MQKNYDSIDDDTSDSSLDSSPSTSSSNNIDDLIKKNILPFSKKVLDIVNIDKNDCFNLDNTNLITLLSEPFNRVKWVQKGRSLINHSNEKNNEEEEEEFQETFEMKEQVNSNIKNDVIFTGLNGNALITHKCANNSCNARTHMTRNLTTLVAFQPCCYICGRNRKDLDLDYLSIDAVDPTKLHKDGNIAGACIDCQFGKQDKLIPDYVNHLERMMVNLLKRKNDPSQINVS